MRLLFLTKRFSTGQDVLQARSGRMYELPTALASLGHDVVGVCLSYRRMPVVADSDSGGVQWYDYGVARRGGLGFPEYLLDLQGIVKSHKPDVVVGASDSLHAVVAAALARRHGLPYVLDLYDNFESFGLTKLPLLKHAFRSVVNSANAVSVVSEELAEHVRLTCKPQGQVSVIENAIPSCTFVVENMYDARTKFGLPPNCSIIGTAGALEANRGIATLYESFLHVADFDSTVHLALAGRTDAHAPIPDHPRVHYIGEIQYERVPSFLCTLDLGVICNQPGGFGSYCFPQKLYEMLACRIPVVAANVGVTGRLFEQFPTILYEPGDSGSLAGAIRSQLHSPFVPDLHVPEWREQGHKLEALLKLVCRNYAC